MDCGAILCKNMDVPGMTDNRVGGTVPMIMAKTFSAILSAITLSVIFTFYQRDDLGSYSFEYVFGAGSMLLAAFYLLAGVPLSVMADFIANRSRRRFVPRAAVYFIVAAGFGLLFLLYRDWGGVAINGSALRMLLLFGLAGAVFAAYEYLTERMIGLMKR